MSLSKASEKRIMDALEKVAALTNDGMHPNDAIIKIASESSIPHGHIQLMVNAFNTGRTNAHRMTHDDPIEKAGEFPVADSAAILSELYPNEVQTKAAQYDATVIATDYNKSPKFLTAQKSREKAARAVDWKLTDKKPIVERDPDTVVKRAMITIKHAHSRLEDDRRKLDAYRMIIVKVAEDLREYFNSPQHIPFVEVAENAAILFGKQADVVLKNVKPEKEKYASTIESEVTLDRAPYSLIKRAIEIASQFSQLQAEYHQGVEKAEKEARELLRPFGPGPESGLSVLADLCWQPSNKLAGFADFVGKGFGLIPAIDVGKSVAKGLGIVEPDREQVNQKALRSVLDPQHEMQLRNIQAESLLNDLMANDEVIRGYDPEEAVDAFNEVSQLTPHAANNKPIMRDLVRKRLSGGAGALDSFLIGDTLKQQQTLRDLSTPSEPKLNVLKELGVLSSAKQKQQEPTADKKK